MSYITYKQRYHSEILSIIALIYISRKPISKLRNITDVGKFIVKL